MSEPPLQTGVTHAAPCDLCGGTEFTIVSERDRHGQPLTTGLCRGCGLVMHLPVPSEAEVAEYYASRYRRDYHGERVPSPRRVMRAWRNGERIYAQLQPHLKAGMSVFEVGAGLGCTVKVFETHGHPARGIEPNTDFNRYSREQIRARVENTNLYELADAGSPDLILLIHVIEHFVSPRKALEHIHGLLAQDGLFYVECPNLSGPFATFERMFHYAHIYNFTHRTLTALAESCGFRLVHAFSREDEPDIQLLFRRVSGDASREGIDALAGHADEVMRAMHRYNTLSYHLRPAYLSRRLRKLASYASEAVLARRFVRRLTERLAGDD